MFHARSAPVSFQALISTFGHRTDRGPPCLVSWSRTLAVAAGMAILTPAVSSADPFSVQTFRPWAGYSMPNGDWQVADLNGDGKADLVHVVQGADYVHTWTSRGDGTFTVGTFRPWAGYTMPNGVWRAGDLNGDGKADLVHVVQGADYVHTWISRGDGTFTVGTYSPWAGYTMPNGLWLDGDITGDRKMDLVHVVQGADYVHTWISVMPGPGEIGVAGLEVTQTVQDMPQNVGLVTNKRTVARAYLDINAPGPLAVTGDILVWRSSPAPGFTRIVGANGNATVDPARNSQIRAQRETLTASLNFVLPPEVLGNGPMVVRLLNVRNATNGTPVGCPSCATTTRAVTFRDAPPLRVRVLGITYPFGTPPTTQAPRTLDFDHITSWLTRVYPTARVQMTRVNVPATATWPFNCNQTNTQLSAIRNVDVSNNSVDARTHYFGLVWDGGGFMRGCASGIPSGADPTVVASGPTGTSTFGWDNDGSYGDWYTGHELGHTFGRFHIGSGCGESSDDPGYPFPAGQLSSADGAFVGFDVGDAAAGLPVAALPGTQWHDVMSYCSNQWISSYTYQGIWDRLTQEDRLPEGAPMIAADTNVRAAAGAGRPAPSGTQASNTARAEAQPPEVVVGHEPPQLATTAAAQPPAPKDGGPGPVAPATPAATPLQLPNPALAAAPPIERGGTGPRPEGAPTGGQEAGVAAEHDGLITPEMRAALQGQLQSERKVEASTREMPGVEVREGDFVNVVASVNVTKSTGEIAYVNPVSRAVMPTSLEARLGEAEVRAVDANGRVLASWPATIRFDTDKEPGEDRTGIIDAFIPAPPATAAFEVLLSGRIVARRDVGAPLPARGVAAGTGTLAVSSAAEPGERVLDWSSAGPTPVGVTYSVLASTDGGSSWQTLAVGLREPRLRIGTEQFGVGRLQVRVIASNGLKTEEVATRDVEVNRR
jgi:hypothetical protein